MSTVIPVKFAYAARDLWFDPKSSDAQEGDHVICATERGTEIGLATSGPREIEASELERIIGKATLKPVLRVASEADLIHAERLAKKGDDAFPAFRRLVAESGLDMKPVGVEYLFGGEKVVCYFAAEERVDFRQLVRDISHELHERIDMRQIGVREEAAVVGGFGHCGQELCCARFGLSFEPVSIRMAKEQDLPLTSNKISGACGRLMCCLRYEFEAYRDFKARAPKRNAVIDTPLGKAKIVEYDTPKEQICLRIESGKVVRIPLAEMETSQAAIQKSEELHCPCRPDTVVRASLEKLSSPDVQMALAELDRKNGVTPPDAFDEADLFVESKPRRRRGRKGRSDAATQPQEASPAQAAEQQEQTSRRSRRRRRKDATAPETRGQASTQGQKEQAVSDAPTPEKRSRRRRHRKPNAQEAAAPTQQTQQRQDAAQQKSNDQTPRKETRRRHHHASGSVQGTGQDQGAQRTKRRPGDRAGQKAQQQQNSQQQNSQQQGAQQQAQTKARDASSGDAAPKRRRRRRGGRGRGGKQSNESQPTKE